MFDHISPWPAIIGLVRDGHLMQRDLFAFLIVEGRDLADWCGIWFLDFDALAAKIGYRPIDIVDLEDDARGTPRRAICPLGRQHAEVAAVTDAGFVVFFDAVFFVGSGKRQSERVLVPFAQSGDVFCGVRSESD